MIKRLLKRIFKAFGFQLARYSSEAPVADFKLHRYTDSDGQFDYEKYRRVQEAGNRRKIDNVWVREGNIQQLSDYILAHSGRVQFGICHGTRRGKEQEWFRKYLNCEVIGTELSDTAESFPNTIRHDFHEVKPEWIGKTDFIYSNSLDHSYDPEKAIAAWIQCLRPGGLCFIEHTDAHDSNHATELDPFGASLALMPYLIAKWGRDVYGLRELLEARERQDGVRNSHILVLQRWPDSGGSN